MADRFEFDSEEAAYRSWDRARDRMNESSWSKEGRATGIWAIDQLQVVLGEQWAMQQKSNYLLASHFHAVAYAQLLEFALQLHLLSGATGMGQIHRDLINDVRPERRLHTQLMLDVASLAVQCGHSVNFEMPLKHGLSPTDVVLTTQHGSLEIEVSTVHMDQSMRDGIDYNDRIDRELDRIRSKYGVEISGSLETVLSNIETSKWVASVEEAALWVKLNGKVQTVKHLDDPVMVRPFSDMGRVQPVFTGPPILGKNNDRLHTKLLNKAAQAVGAGATWIRMDVIDGLWQFTPWAMQPLQEKGEELAKDIAEALSGIDGLHGAVLSSGPAMSLGQVVNECIQLCGGGFAMALNLPSFRARETIIIPLQIGHDNDVAEWVEMYNGEPDWLDWALQQAGLPSSATIFPKHS